ncbi:MAG: PaaI family thioesterase [Bacillota bacterium]|nr:PaaI family thioesterase [Bacillota bacterium]
MRELNQVHVTDLIKLINQGPYFELLSMVMKDLGVGSCLLEVNVEEKHHNPFGGLHGGVYASTIDTATYWAAYCELDEDAGLVTLDLKVNYLAPIKKGKIIVKGQRIKIGKKVGLAEAVVTDLEGKILAKGTSTLMLTPGMQTIRDVLRLRNGETLPPKFIG